MNKLMLNKSLHQSRRGLVLLLALGMLALFSLLAVTYIVAASNSRAGAQAMKIRANTSNSTAVGMADDILHQALRGTRDQKSAFYQHALLEDIYDSRAIRVQFGNRSTPPDPSSATIAEFPEAAFNNNPNWCVKLTPAGQPGIEIVKLSLDPRNPDLFALNPDQSPTFYRLNPLENAYNARILTVLEGPLAGHSFRILKYVGFVRSGLVADSMFEDPNTPSNPTYTLPNVNSSEDPFDYDYSITIDLSPITGSLSGRWQNPATGLTENFSGTIGEWIGLPNSPGVNGFGLRNLFYFFNENTRGYQGYRCVINGAPFSNAGIGIEDDPNSEGYGNLDSRRVMAIPTDPTRKISPALLPNYDYLQDQRIMEVAGNQVGVPGIGDQFNYAFSGPLKLRGQSNEGHDVPDWRDFWLAHQDFKGTPNLQITPSFHRPELAAYIAHLFGDPSALSPSDVRQLLLLLDSSTARVLSYEFQAGPLSLSENSGFRPSSDSVQFKGVADLQAYVRSLIEGPWDVDNDRDGIRDSVWINPNLPEIHAPDGRMLKPLAAILIEDLDGRINLNLHGDRIQGNAASFNAFATNAGYFRSELAFPLNNLPQGFGYGPADISMNQLFRFDTQMLTSGTVMDPHYSIFDERYGAKPAEERTGPIDLSAVDRAPGRREIPPPPPGVIGGDVLRRIRKRELQYDDPGSIALGGPFPGSPIGQRTIVAPAFDRNGNLSFVRNQVTDASPDYPFTTAHPSEAIGDSYESGSGLQPHADTPFTFTELEAILRRFDDDVEALPQHLREHLQELGWYDSTSELNRLITTHSAELRYPKLAAAASYPQGNSARLEKDAGNMLGLIRYLHEQRYRRRSFGLPPPLIPDEPELSVDALYQLFPPEFANNLRLDLNRAFGNGYDSNGNGEIDEPAELYFGGTEIEPTAGINGTGFPEIVPSGVSGGYRNQLRNPQIPNYSDSRTYLGSRQLLARYLYCLAQLVIPREYEFPNMRGITDVLDRYRLRARSIAQWAVNVVDFRDTDSAMTRFEYDVFPFGINEAGFAPKYAPKLAFWAPDQDTIDRDFIGVVWGMEMPELLLTESLAFHDKRIRDTDMDTAIQPTRIGDPMEPMEDMDQYRFPQGSLFLELYAPRSAYQNFEDVGVSGVSVGVSNGPAIGQSRGLYENQAGNIQLNLSKLAPSIPGSIWGRQPVWRIGINESTSPTSTNQARQANVVYQSNFANNLPPAASERREFQSSQTNVLLGNSTSPSLPAGSVENQIGSGLFDDLSEIGETNAANVNGLEFERMVVFVRNPDMPAIVPDLIGNDTSTFANTNLRHLVYYNRSPSDAFLTGGSYAVVGPRLDTPIGSLTTDRNGNPWPAVLLRNAVALNPPTYSPSHQSIGLGPTLPFGVSSTLLNGENIFRYRTEWNAAVKPAVGIPCAADPPEEDPNNPPADPNQRWNLCFQRGVGINVSMPNPIQGQGYWRDSLMPWIRLNPSDTQPGNLDGFAEIDPDSWVDLTLATPPNDFPDIPFDYSDTPRLNPILNPGSGAGTPMNKTGTYPNVRTAFLQRLADPDLPYDPINNPYITVDWISIDLTVFNGEALFNDDPFETMGQAVPVAFQSRYKDGAAQNTASAKAWAGAPAAPPSGQPTATGSPKGYSYHSFSTAELRETPPQSLQQPSAPPNVTRYPSYFMRQLGYATQQPADVTGNQPKHHSATTLGYVNVGYRFNQLVGVANEPADEFDGFGPPLAFTNTNFNGSPRDLTSVVWLNRPFATPHELMLVPTTSPGQFGLKHNVADIAKFRNPFDFLPSFHNSNALTTNLDWDLNDYPVDTSGSVDEAEVRNYGYWMRRSGSWPVNGTQPIVQGDWSFLLEFVETQPQYIDSSKFLDPVKVQNSALASNVARRFLDSYIPLGFTGANEPETVRGPTLRAPNNHLPTYLSPGKINLNTITRGPNGRSEALQAIEYLYLTGANRDNFLTASDATTGQFFVTRQGFTGGANSNFFGAASPAHINPNFPTQFAGAYRSGLSANLQPAAPNPLASPADRLPIRQQRGRFPIETGTQRSLFPNANPGPPQAMDNVHPLFSPDALIASATPTELNDANRNAFTRYQRMMRLPNLVTDQSNVFAVWVTVSLFEYDPITGFGREYVSASGEEQRERAFYIIDRTVPVGFVPGEDLNTDKTILLRRKISGER